MNLFRARFPLVLQEEFSECGAACLAMVLRHFGKHVTLDTLRSQRNAHASGMTLRAIIELARANGLSAQAFKVEPSDVRDLPIPSVLHWDMTHYVVLVRPKRDGVLIHDPASGERFIRWREFDRRFTGIALELRPAPGFTEQKPVLQRGYLDLIRSMPGLKLALINALLLTAVLQFAVMLAPRYLQIMVDRVLNDGRQDLILAITGGFFAVAVFTALTQLVRALVLNRLASRFKAYAKTGFVNHLLSLPDSFFSKRRTSELTSRVESLEAIQSQVSTKTIEAGVDILAVVVASCALLFMAPMLGMITLAMILLVIVTRESLHGRMIGRTRDAILAQTKERSNLYDTISTIDQLKAIGGVASRAQRWSAMHATSVASSERAARTVILDETLQTAIPAITLVVWIMLGVQSVGSGAVSLGELYALLAYNGIALSHSQSLLRSVRDFRLLRVHFERIQDILTAESEPPLALSAPSAFDIALDEVSFRYPGCATDTLSGVTVDIREGECVGIQGVSGAGKSTLARLMLGLIEPTTGSVRIGTHHAHEIRRSQLADRVVGFIQNDSSLFEGTVLENVTLFCTEPDEGRVETILAALQLSPWLASLPNGVNTLITSPRQVSGGQLQRLMLARIMYAQPRVIILDESTSNLDMQTELGVIQWILSQKITCALISHRNEAINLTDRVLLVEDGRVYEKTGLCKTSP